MPRPKNNERKLQAMELKLHGMTIETISQKLGVSTRTIDKDLAERRKELAKYERKEDMWEKIAQLSENQRERLKRLWLIATDPDSTKRDKMRAIDLLQKEDELFIKRGQIAGILPKEAPLVAIQQNNIVNKISLAEAYQEHIKQIKTNEE